MELTPKKKAIIIPKLQDLRSCNLSTLFIHYLKILHNALSIIQISSKHLSVLQLMIFLYKFNLPNLEIQRTLHSRQLLNCEFIKRLSTYYIFIASSVRLEKNLKALLIKANKCLGGEIV